MRGGSVCVLRGRRYIPSKRVNSSESFLVAGTILWQVQHFVTWRRWCFDESQCQGCANITQCQRSWQGQHFVSALKNLRDIVDFQLQSARKPRTKCFFFVLLLLLLVLLVLLLLSLLLLTTIIITSTCIITFNTATHFSLAIITFKSMSPYVRPSTAEGI